MSACNRKLYYFADDAPHALDDRRCRMALLERDADDPATARLDGVAADNLIRSPVGAFHEDVGLHGSNDLGRRVLVEEDDGVDGSERGHHLGAFEFGRDRTCRAFVAPHRGIAVEADDQEIAKRAAPCRYLTWPGCSRSKTPFVKTIVSPRARCAATKSAHLGACSCHRQLA